MIDESEPPEAVPDADVELRDRLRATGCAGPAWDYVASELAHYGWSVMSAWLRTGMIAQKCQQKGRRVELPSDWTADDREDLVATAVANGMEIFRQALIDDRWKPKRGASLKTYFLGGCILAFPNALRQWRNDRQRYNRAAMTFALHEVTASRSMVEPFDVVDAIDALRSLTRDENQRTQAIRSLCFDNYTPAEIAEILGMTTGAVKAALVRMRRRASHHRREAG